MQFFPHVDLIICTSCFVLQQLDAEEQQVHQDQETRAEQQTSTVNRVLSTSIELTDE